jgi:invasion protein IalB
MHKLASVATATFGLVLAVLPALAEADGPDYWKVSGVRADDVLNVHQDATARSPTVATIPHNADSLRNLGCTGLPKFGEWQRMSPNQRDRASKARWCKVEYQGKTGWVAGRFLAEGSAAGTSDAKAQVGPWKIGCRNSVCAMEQVGIATSSRTVLRIERIPQDPSNARVVIEREHLPRKGTLAIYMDGELITTGSVAPFSGKQPGAWVMYPDDITLGLLKQMSRHKNMVVSFPGEERGIEIHLEHFSEARRKLEELDRARR